MALNEVHPLTGNKILSLQEKRLPALPFYLLASQRVICVSRM